MIGIKPICLASLTHPAVAEGLSISRHAFLTFSAVSLWNLPSASRQQLTSHQPTSLISLEGGVVRQRCYNLALLYTRRPLYYAANSLLGVML